MSKKNVLTQYPPAHSCKYYGLRIFWLTVDQVLTAAVTLFNMQSISNSQPTVCQLHSADIISGSSGDYNNIVL